MINPRVLGQDNMRKPDNVGMRTKINSLDGRNCTVEGHRRSVFWTMKFVSQILPAERPNSIPGH